MEVESALFKLDTNGDGIITVDEFVDWWRSKDDVFI
jgi:Ca2+-binding EF-hand superfamily protein